MIAAVVILAVCTAGGVAGLVALTVWLRDALTQLNASDQAVMRTVRERDAFKVAVDEKTAETIELRARIAQVEDQRNRTYADTLMQVRNKIENAPTVTDAMRVVTDLFAQTLPGSAR